jgi:hypothetical protein
MPRSQAVNDERKLSGIDSQLLDFDTERVAYVLKRVTMTPVITPIAKAKGGFHGGDLSTNWDSSFTAQRKAQPRRAKAVRMQS